MTFKVKDYYFQKAKKENYVARSVYKLQEIDKRFKILRQGDLVADFGYYPGSWMQYTSEVVGERGLVVGLDIQEVNETLLGLKNVKLFQKDIFSITDLKDIEVEKKFDVVLSDMAPSTTGIKFVDQTKSCQLVEKVFEMLPLFLKPNGNLVIKVFEGQEVQVFLKKEKKRFQEFQYLKPKSTRSVSKEFFVIAKKFLA